MIRVNTRLTCLLSAVLALSAGFTTAGAQDAQDSVAATEAENSNFWFVELAGPPTADGARLANVRSEKNAFRKAAQAAGIDYKELRSFDVLFNGFSVEVGPAQRAALGSLPGVKALWPIDVIEAPQPPTDAGSFPDLFTAIGMTGADIVQNELGFTGAGVRVAVMDTGIDYDHLAFGGDGVARSNSPMFPNSRVVAGWDFVGDDFTAGLTPEPDQFPDDCGGHGSHVAGIVGANTTITGVAPGVVFGAYRVFGCDGSTTADIMLAAMERALADDMHVLNMSIGSRTQWPQYPTGAAATRLLKKGMVVVASAGNNGPGGSAPDGPYAGGAPGVGHDVIGVASYNNTIVAQSAFTVDPGGLLIGYGTATGAPPPPTSGTFPLAKTGTPATTDDGCFAAQYAGFPAGSIALVQRGGCTFHIKAANAQDAGAAALIIYNNAPGAINPTVVGAVPITIPVVAIFQADGITIDGVIEAGGATLTWGSETVSTPNVNPGLISGFSSFGMAPDLTLKPDIGAPGGNIYSTIPLEQGGHGQNSGTSMAAPHVAGAVALLLEAEPNIAPEAVRARLQNSATPTIFNLLPTSSFIDNVHRQGAGLLDIEASILATVDVTPGKLSLGESEAGPQTRTLTIRNRGSSAVTFDLSHMPAIATGPKAQAPSPFQLVSYFADFASANFSAASVTVPGGGSASVDVTITAPGAPDQGQYGGYVVLTPQGDGQTYRVPYAGFVGDYQTVPVLTPGVNGFPWLAQLIGTTYNNRPDGQAYTMEGDDVPYFLVHLDHQSRYYEFRVFDAATGAPIHPVFANFEQDDYVGRNTTSTGFFAFAWDGTRSHDSGQGSGDHRKFVANGDYIVELRVLKALGDKNNPDHWETWTSPIVTIARP